MNSSGEGIGINMIRMSHKGVALNFQKEIDHQLIGYGTDTEKLKMLSLEFQDIQEMDILINALESFKDTCQLYVGRWKRI